MKFPAFRAGFTTEVQIVAVNNVAFDGDKLRTAVKGTKGNGPPVELLVKQGDRYRTVRLDYHDGLRYPHLERIDAAPRLDDILSPRPR
jgi:predicted metalloprotease with PDZ domain